MRWMRAPKANSHFFLNGHAPSATRTRILHRPLRTNSSPSQVFLEELLVRLKLISPIHTKRYHVAAFTASSALLKGWKQRKAKAGPAFVAGSRSKNVNHGQGMSWKKLAQIRVRRLSAFWTIVVDKSHRKNHTAKIQGCTMRPHSSPKLTAEPDEWKSSRIIPLYPIIGRARRVSF